MIPTRNTHVYVVERVDLELELQEIQSDRTWGWRFLALGGM